jgi:ATP-dependent Zn protease
MACLMDQEIQKMIIDEELRATEILAGKRLTLDALAEVLIKEEMLERADVERIILGSKE